MNVFNPSEVDSTKEFIFFGEHLNVSRFDQQKFVVFEKLTEKTLSFFWRPEEVDLSRDKLDYTKLSDAEKHIFTSNLKYQTFLDSVQGRSVNLMYLPIVSIPEMESFIEWWGAMEVLHSRSYSHILRNVYPNPSDVLDSIVLTPEILERAKVVGAFYDDFLNSMYRFYAIESSLDATSRKETLFQLKRKLLLALFTTFMLESVRFFLSFSCSFSFAERGLMEGNAKIIKLIARDEALHTTAVQHVMGIYRNGQDDPEMTTLFNSLKEDFRAIARLTAEQEKEWADYLFSKGQMIGVSKETSYRYVEHLVDKNLAILGLEPIYNSPKNPYSWINTWLSSDSVQVAPQETEISSYVVGSLDSNVVQEERDELSGLLDD